VRVLGPQFCRTPGVAHIWTCAPFGPRVVIRGVDPHKVPSEHKDCHPPCGPLHAVLLSGKHFLCDVMHDPGPSSWGWGGGQGYRPSFEYADMRTQELRPPALKNFWNGSIIQNRIASVNLFISPCLSRIRLYHPTSHISSKDLKNLFTLVCPPTQPEWFQRPSRDNIRIVGLEAKFPFFRFFRHPAAPSPPGMLYDITSKARAAVRFASL